MRPTWQVTPCPSWCDGGHQESDHPDDRVHRSAATTVPVLSRRVVSAEPLRYSTSADEFAVGLSRRDDDDEVWVYIGSGPGEYVEVAAADGARLVAALQGEIGRALGESRTPS